MSCSKQEFSGEMPSVPEDIEIDINEDSAIDFAITFSTADIDFPAPELGNFGIIGSIELSDGNEV